MAGEEERRRKTFMTENDVMRFNISDTIPKDERELLEQQIREGGGIVSNYADAVVLIKKAPPVPSPSLKITIHPDYISESLKYGQQPFEEYIIDDENAFKGRTRYSTADDRKITEFVQAHPQHSINGNQLWKLMEKEKITHHSWESMKSRYVRILVPKIKTTNVILTKKKKTQQGSPVDSVAYHAYPASTAATSATKPKEPDNEPEHNEDENEGGDDFDDSDSISFNNNNNFLDSEGDLLDLLLDPNMDDITTKSTPTTSTSKSSVTPTYKPSSTQTPKPPTPASNTTQKSTKQDNKQSLTTNTVKNPATPTKPATTPTYKPVTATNKNTTSVDKNPTDKNTFTNKNPDANKETSTSTSATTNKNTSSTTATTSTSKNTATNAKRQNTEPPKTKPTNTHTKSSTSAASDKISKLVGEKRPLSTDTPSSVKRSRTLLSRMAKELNVPTTVIFHACVLASGSVNKAKRYLLEAHLDPSNLWLPNEDEILSGKNNAEELQQLIKTHGKEACRVRIDFLDTGKIKDST